MIRKAYNDIFIIITYDINNGGGGLLHYPLLKNISSFNNKIICNIPHVNVETIYILDIEHIVFEHIHAHNDKYGTSFARNA